MARREGVPMFPIIDQGLHTHSCHYALTWPSGLHGLELKVVTWQCKATTWHGRASSLLERSLLLLLGLVLPLLTCVDDCLWLGALSLGCLGLLACLAPTKAH